MLRRSARKRGAVRRFRKPARYLVAKRRGAAVRRRFVRPTGRRTRLGFRRRSRVNQGKSATGKPWVYNPRTVGFMNVPFFRDNEKAVVGVNTGVEPLDIDCDTNLQGAANFVDYDLVAGIIGLSNATITTSKWQYASLDKLRVQICARVQLVQQTPPYGNLTSGNYVALNLPGPQVFWMPDYWLENNLTAGALPPVAGQAKLSKLVAKAGKDGNYRYTVVWKNLLPRNKRWIPGYRFANIFAAPQAGEMPWSDRVYTSIQATLLQSTIAPQAPMDYIGWNASLPPKMIFKMPWLRVTCPGEIGQGPGYGGVSVHVTFQYRITGSFSVYCRASGRYTMRKLIMAEDVVTDKEMSTDE